jgi:type IV pilus assembly protein PilO
MTYADEIGIPGEGQEDTPSYPTAFGITFTPRIGGAICGVLGLLGATYLLLNVVQPAWQQYQDLNTSVEDKKAQLQQQQQIQKQIKDTEAKLAQAKQQNKQVLSLFANEKTLNTLLLNLNSFVKDRKGTLVRFEPAQEPEANAVVNDGSLGPQVNGKLKRKVVNVELEGSFDQVQSILRSFERLQSLLLVKDFKTELKDDQGFLINPQNNKVTPAIFKREDNKVVPGGKPTIKSTFKLEALSPVTEEQEAAKNAAAKPAQNP